MIQDRTYVGVPRLVSPMMYGRWLVLHSIRYMRFFEWEDMESVIFRASLVAKNIVCLTLSEKEPSEKRTSEAAWVVALF